ncbi:MAG: HAD family hydrolase [Planctomycetota bacterium]
MLDGVRTLFLDAGGVLANPDWDRVAEALTRHGHPVSGDDLRSVESKAKHAMDTPEQIGATDDNGRGPVLFRGVLRLAGLDPDAEGMDACWDELLAYHLSHNLWDAVPDGVHEALDRFRAGGLGLVVVSNSEPTLEPLLVRLGLREKFDHVIVSAVVGVEKPDPGIFEIALERSGADRQSTVYVGDYFEIDVAGARAAGLRAILVDPGGLYADRDVNCVPDLATLANSVPAT